MVAVARFVTVVYAVVTALVPATADAFAKVEAVYAVILAY